MSIKKEYNKDLKVSVNIRSNIGDVRDGLQRIVNLLTEVEKEIDKLSNPDELTFGTELAEGDSITGVVDIAKVISAIPQVSAGVMG